MRKEHGSAVTAVLMFLGVFSFKIFLVVYSSKMSPLGLLLQDVHVRVILQDFPGGLLLQDVLVRVLLQDVPGGLLLQGVPLDHHPLEYCFTQSWCRQLGFVLNINMADLS